MKLSIILSVVPAVLALPTGGDEAVSKRQGLNAVTDQLLFTYTLPVFTTHRNALDPAGLDWSSDGCTSSPDNPFGFPFVPACHRHDFGYQNFRIQKRFTESGKARIDNNFHTDLNYQCESVRAKSACRALADVYYAAVRAFGGGDATPGRRDEDLVKIYEEKVALYKQAVAEAQERGELPRLAE